MPAKRSFPAATLIRLQFLGLALVFACASALAQASVPADAIYFNGTILTVVDSQPTAEAVAIHGGIITAVGSRDLVAKQKGPATRMIDLHSKTMLPGFVDGHSHIGGLVMDWGVPNLAPPPVGTVNSIADIQRIMRQAIANSTAPAGDLIVGEGYDDSLLAEKRHPNRADLDAVTAERSLCIVHISGHLISCNSHALAQMHIDSKTPDPQGGRIFHDALTGEPTGVLGDQAALPVYALVKPKSFEQQKKDFLEVQRYYASFGYTTAQEGATTAAIVKLLEYENHAGNLKLDVVAYPIWNLVNSIIKTEGIQVGSAVPYNEHLKFPGIKVFGDGSPQGKTAYLSTPYLHPPAGFDPFYRGFPILKQDQLNDVYAHAFSQDWQVQTHCNGDACIDMVLEAIRKADAAQGAKQRRPVVIHSQVVRADQLDAYRDLHIIPSFFEAHTYYWGDWHRKEVLGPERAAFISPLASAQKRGILFSIHSDAPVTPPNPMLLWWAAVNRLTRTNFVLGPNERIDSATALKALTIWAAYQQYDEKLKGTLEAGKYADFVILAENPLAAPAAHLRDIKVLETIKQGETLWKAN